MQLLTNSRRSCYNRCARQYYYRYKLGFIPRKTPDALRFGSLIHAALELYWTNGIDVAVDYLATCSLGDYDAYEIETARQLIVGYYFKWWNEDKAIIPGAITEKEFKAPLLNPEAKRRSTSKTFELSGKIDVIDTINHRIIEHKTTSDPIEPASDYWQRLALDGQISGYYAGAEALGYECKECVYDVIRKPSIRPYKATPEDARKYKKDGSLYANQRLGDETPEEYGERLAQDIKERPDRYFARKIATRSTEDMAEYMTDMWCVGQAIITNERLSSWARNPNNCSSFGTCPYFAVCTKQAVLEDATIYKQVHLVDSELSVIGKEKKVLLIFFVKTKDFNC